MNADIYQAGGKGMRFSHGQLVPGRVSAIWDAFAKAHR